MECLWPVPWGATMASNAERAAELLAPILARPETPQEHVRHGIMLIHEAQRELETTCCRHDRDDALSVIDAALDRLWKAIEQLERP